MVSSLVLYSTVYIKYLIIVIKSFNFFFNITIDSLLIKLVMMNEAQKIFIKYDKYHNGSLDINEFKQAFMKLIGPSLAENQLKKAVKFMLLLPKYLIYIKIFLSYSLK